MQPGMSRFSFHSLQRVRERCQISLHTVNKLLNAKKYVLLGNSKGLSGKLLYDIRGGRWFVVIQDISTYSIVTILTGNMKLQWPVTERQKQQARDMVMTKMKEEEEIYKGDCRELDVEGILGKVPKDKKRLIVKLIDDAIRKV